MPSLRRRWFWLFLSAAASLFLWLALPDSSPFAARLLLWAVSLGAGCGLAVYFWPGGEPGRTLIRGRGDSARPEKMFGATDELMDSVLRAMVEGLVVVDKNQRVLACNAAVAGLLNRPPKESRGLHLWEVLRHREVGDLVSRAFSERKEQVKEITLPLPEEVFMRVRVRSFPRDGELRGAVITFNDYTQLKRLETIRRDFVANVSHELRTPLTALRAALETLLDGAMDDPKYAREFLGTAEDQVGRLQRLIDDLLTLSQLDKPSSATDSSASADLASTVDKVFQVLSPVAGQRRVALSASWPKEKILVALSADELTQVFMNILDNAIKFNRESGRVDVSAEKHDRFAEVRVKDTGIGIPDEDLSRIFERFYRVDKARSREFGGTGLGLSIVKHIVENRGGSIRAASVPGQGSEFIVSLPLASH